MKTIPVRLNYDFAGLAKVVITNEMAPLSIGSSASGKIEIEADLMLSDRNSELPFERYFDVGFDNHTATIELEEIPELEDGFMRGSHSQVRVLVPEGIEVQAETENLPLMLSGLKCVISVENENGPIVISECEGSFTIENENGPVKMLNCSGALQLTQENGPFSAEGLAGDSLGVETENGAIKIRSASFKQVNVTSENGMIYYESMPMEDGTLSFESENGKIALVLPEDFDFEMTAECENGIVKCNLNADIQREDGNYVIRQGEGKTKIRVRTENGVIKLSSDAYMNLGFLKQKLNELREAIRNSKTLDDQAKVQEMLDKIISSLEKAADKISEARIKEAIIKGVASLKATVEGMDLADTRDKVVAGVEKIGEDIASGFREFIVKMKYSDEEGSKTRHFHLHKEMDGIREYIHKVLDREFVEPRTHRAMNQREQQDVNDRSRLKILEMLESGKITAEEAERLLTAIGKE